MGRGRHRYLHSGQGVCAISRHSGVQNTALSCVPSVTEVWLWAVQNRRAACEGEQVVSIIALRNCGLQQVG